MQARPDVQRIEKTSSRAYTPTRRMCNSDVHRPKDDYAGSSDNAMPAHPIQKMPVEIMLTIFRMCCTLASQHRASSYFDSTFPPVLVLSQVCAEWRRLLMNAPEFWSDVEMGYDSCNLRLVTLWFSRAGDIPRSFTMLSADRTRAFAGIEGLLFQYPFRKLNLMCTLKGQIQLSEIPIQSLVPLESLTLHLCCSPLEKTMTPWFYPHTFPNLNYMRLSGPFDFHSFDAIPACNTLRYLHLRCPVPRSMYLAILSRIPNLEGCSLEVSDHAMDAMSTASEIIAPKLVSLQIDFSQNRDLETFFHIFTAPSLEKLKIGHRRFPSPLAFDAPMLCRLARRGATPKLQTIFIHGSSSLFDLGLMLAHFPLMSSVKILAETVLDEDTMCQIADGVLGPRLEELGIDGVHDIGRILNMLESRQSMIQKQLQSGVVDTISRLCRVRFDARGDGVMYEGAKYQKRIVALYEQGIHVNYH